MTFTYRNGEVPQSLLITFASGWNSVDGAWTHSLPPSTYQKHLALVALAKRNTGRDLRIGVGWCAYRPLAAQVRLKQRLGIMAATPGTSSHGLFWEGAQVAAIDYSNWSEVYGGNRAAWFRDVRAVGFEPDLISPRRGYPDEPWHVIDKNPWAAGGAGAGAASEEDVMNDAQEKKLDMVLEALGAGGLTPGMWSDSIMGNVRAILKQVNGSPGILEAIRGQVNGLPDALAAIRASVGVSDAQVKAIADAVVKQVGTPTVKIDYAAIAKVVNDDTARRLAS